MRRREFLRAAAIAALSSKYLRAQSAPSTPLPKSLLTPNADFFVRNHFKTPTINEQKWTLDIAGAVATSIKLSYSDLLLATSVRRPLTTECAGNLSGGAGVGTAIWSGVPLADLLKQAGVQAKATTIIFHGADAGDAEGMPPGTHYARAIPLEKHWTLQHS